MHKQPGEWMVVVNPNAGKGRGEKDWHRIAGLLEQQAIYNTPVFTVSKGHAIQLTRDYIMQGYRNVIVVGGDGTLNEVVNGVFTQHACHSTDITLAMITVGTGNDWGKMYSIPSDYEGAVRIIRERKTRLQDAGLTEYYVGGRQESRYFLNIAGLGFDAAVVKRTNGQKEKGRSGKALYFVNLLNILMYYEPTRIAMEIDGRKLSGEVFTISIGIGRFSGGGMRQTPRAVPDDGLFDITLVNKIGKGELILSLKKLYDGTILEHPKIQGFTGKVIRIESNPPIHLEADGETLGHSPVQFRIIPRSINIVYGSLPEAVR